MNQRFPNTICAFPYESHIQARRIPLLLTGAERVRRTVTHLSRAVQNNFLNALPDRSAGTAPRFPGKQINRSHIDTPEKTRTGRIPTYP